MPRSNMNDSKHWRNRAAAMRALAATMKDPELADDYDSLADRAQLRDKGSVPRSCT
jgi:hypothetical protein